MNSAALQVLPAQHVRDDTIPSPIATPSPVTTDDPSSMSASTSAASRPDKPLKKSNPLIDLIETEKQYVDLLASIIRRVAAAWSKDNFPPKELDTMFRCVEAIYKANRTLLARLKDIGPSPSSPKALGDLLMRWIDDLEEPYERYCSSYIAGFDLWSPVQQNQKLSQMLDEVSASTSSGQAEGEFVGWTLDSLFLLPRGRLKYYKRLYSRLLKSTQPGRSDHRLLVVAVEKLDNLLEMVAARLQVNVQELDDIHRSSSGAPREQAQALERGQDVEDPNVENRLSPSPSATARQEPQTGPPELPLLPTPQKLRQMSNLDDGGHKMHDATNVPENLKNGRGVSPDPLPSVVALDSNAATGRLHPSSMSPSAGIAAPPLADRSRNGSTPSLRSVTPSNPTADADKDDRQSGSSGTIAGSQSDDRSSRDTGSTSLGSLGSLPSPSELERKLSVDHVLDIFSMKPKACSLQLSPPDLPFTRSTRASIDAAISCTPLATGVEARTERGHVYLLSDLLLICERGSEVEELSNRTMRLLYPPLAGRFIRMLNQNEEDRTTITVQLLRKVTIVFEAGSQLARDKLLRDLEDCIALASNLPANRGSKTQLPSLPTGSGPNGPASLTRSTSEPLGHNAEYGSRGIPSDPPFPLQPSLPVAGPPVGHNSLPPVPPLGMPQHMNPSLGSTAPHQNFRQYPPRDASLNGTVRPVQNSMSAQHPNAMQYPVPRPGLPPFTQQYPPIGIFPPGPDASYPRRDEMGRPIFQHPGDPSAQPFSGRPEKPLPPHAYSNGPGHGPFPPEMQRGYVDPATFPSPTTSIFVPPSSRSTVLSSRSPSLASSHPSMRPAMEDISPPSSPGEEPKQLTAVISAQMKCKVFLKQAHSQWKSLGGGKLKLYHQQPTNVKQLVVEADTKEKTLMISTIILTDAVERVGKTGVAIELSDKGASTGIVYMIQLRNETSATGLFNSLLAGSDRTTSG